jgi:hypothetical protein
LQQQQQQQFAAFEFLDDLQQKADVRGALLPSVPASNGGETSHLKTKLSRIGAAHFRATVSSDAYVWESHFWG